ncbi:MAG: methionine biosynthesis protein MetW [Terricaulis sp.]
MAHLELVHAVAADNDVARPDHDVIAQLIEPGSRVLDIGCGNGALLSLLANQCDAHGRGLERDKIKARGCVARGLAVVQGDAEHDLASFPANGFDYVILAHTLQCVANPREVLRQAARIGERVIVSVSNYGHYRTRLRLLGKGRMPPPSHRFTARASHWADGDILRPCSIRDFAVLAREERLTIESAVPLSSGRAGAPFAKTLWRANMFAEEAVFLLAS